MSTRHLRFILWSIAGGGLVAGLITVAWGLHCPLAVSAQLPPLPVGPATGPEAAGSTRFDVHPSDARWGLDLRRPLFDPPPTAAAPPPAAAPPLALKLTGTIVEVGHCVAVFQLPDGQTIMKQVGEEAGNAEILEIRGNAVKIRYAGESVTLELPKEGQNG